MARPKSEFLKSFGKAFEVFKLIVDAVLNLGGSDEDLSRLLTDEERVTRIARIIVDPSNEEKIDYVTPVPDAEVPASHQATLAKYRRLATEWGVPAITPVCWRVAAGFTLKAHAPKAGPCFEDFTRLQGWNFPDEPTADYLVFWIPRLVSESADKTKDQQLALLVELRQRLELPAHHLTGFGQVGLLAGLILTHFKATGERIPPNQHWVRTDTCDAGGYRLDLGGFGGTGLYCARWGFDGVANGFLGVFVLGVEVLGN